MSERVRLPGISLLAIQTSTPATVNAAHQNGAATCSAVSRAIDICCRDIDFRNTIVISNRHEMWSPGNDKVTIEPFPTYYDVCVFELTRLPDIILPLMGTHVLNIHRDGFVLNPDVWSDEFLAYDYIGSPLMGQTVGNGGFCLKSRNFFNAVKSLNLTPKWSDCHPSDQIVCVRHRARMEEFGVRFAPLDVANRFARENDPPYGGDVFGGHGKLFVADVVRQGRYV